MEWIIIFAIASAFAVVKGVGSGAGAIRQRYRDHIEPKRSLVRDAIDQGHAGVSVKTGEKVGALAAASVTGWGLAFRALAAGFKSGWSQGKQRGRAIIARYSGEDLCFWPEFKCNEKTVNGTGFCEEHLRQFEAEQEEAGAEPVVETAPDSAPTEEPVAKEQPEQQRPLRLVTTIPSVTKGTTTMAIMSRTGGEVLTKEQFEQEMEGVIAEATAELEDAQADAKRAVEDTNSVEMMSSCMATLQIDAATVAAVRALADTNSARIQNAQARVASAEIRMAAAQKALATFRASAQQTFYAS